MLAIVLRRPSSSETLGRHPSSLVAREMSGQRDRLSPSIEGSEPDLARAPGDVND